MAQLDWRPPVAMPIPLPWSASSGSKPFSRPTSITHRSPPRTTRSPPHPMTMSGAKPTIPSPVSPSPMQHTLDQLKSLRLIGLLEAWQEQQAQPTYHDLAFDERFALLVEREYLRRQQPRLQRRLKQATLFTSATLNDVDFEVPRGLKK